MQSTRIKQTQQTSGRAGLQQFKGSAQVPCLVSVPASRPRRAQRRTRFTVEAVSLDAPDAPDPSWVGINQTAANACAPSAPRLSSVHVLAPNGMGVYISCSLHTLFCSAAYPTTGVP